MIIGDPYKFAICIKVIQQWNIDETFGNGVLLFFIDGNIFPKEILTTTLHSEISPLKEKLGNIAVHARIFQMEKEEAFREIYNITFPEDIDLENDDRFDITPLSFSDNHCYIFAVGDGVQVRILAAKLRYVKKESRHILEDASIQEALISIEEMDEISMALAAE